MSPFLAAFIGGIVGGLTCGVALGVLVAIFGRGLAERFFQEQVAYLERRFKDKVLDALLGRIGAFLDQSERIGQIARRVVEIVQLLLQKGAPAQAAAAAVNGAAAVGAPALAQGHATLGLALAALGRSDEARRSFEEALRLDPQQAIALQGLQSLGQSVHPKQAP